MRARARRWHWAGVGASLMMHALVLAALGWSVAPKLPVLPEGPEPPAVWLELVRRPPPSRSSPAASAARTPIRTTPIARPTPSVLSVPAAQAPASPAVADSAGVGVGAGPHPGPMPAGEPGADLRGFLRATVGCSHADYMRLTEAERTRCDKSFGEAARTAPRLDPVPAEKRAYYDAAVEAYRSARGMETAVAPNHIGKGPKGLDVGGGVHPRCFGVRPTNAIHIPGTRCWIVPQRGVLTEELGLADPASLRERTDDAGHAARFDPPKP